MGFRWYGTMDMRCVAEAWGTELRSMASFNTEPKKCSDNFGRRSSYSLFLSQVSFHAFRAALEQSKAPSLASLEVERVVESGKALPWRSLKFKVVTAELYTLDLSYVNVCGLLHEIISLPRTIPKTMCPHPHSRLSWPMISCYVGLWLLFWGDAVDLISFKGANMDNKG